MIILANGSAVTHKLFASSPYFGHLVTPMQHNSMRSVFESCKPWAADNDCFNGLNKGNFFRMLGKIADKPGCLFVSCPDVVADAKATAERFEIWEPVIRAAGLPVGFVGQDGCEDMELPWSRMAALFIGGSTEWKLSQAAADLIHEAKRRGKWVHIGRINTLTRLRAFHGMGADSCDGTAFSRWPDKFFPRALRWLSELDREREQQLMLFGE